jgi:hypothetical protein
MIDKSRKVFSERETASDTAGSCVLASGQKVARCTALLGGLALAVSPVAMLLLEGRLIEIIISSLARQTVPSAHR